MEEDDKGRQGEIGLTLGLLPLMIIGVGGLVRLAMVMLFDLGCRRNAPLTLSGWFGRTSEEEGFCVRPAQAHRMVVQDDNERADNWAFQLRLRRLRI